MRYPDDECLCSHTADEHAMSARSECVADNCACTSFAYEVETYEEGEVEVWTI